MCMHFRYWQPAHLRSIEVSINQGVISTGLLYMYSGKLSREKTFANFEVFTKVFSAKLGVCHPVAAPASKLRKSYFQQFLQTFSPVEVSRYMIYRQAVWTMHNCEVHE